MDDGSRQKGPGVFISTHSFKYQDVKFLAGLLTELYGCCAKNIGYKNGK